MGTKLPFHRNEQSPNMIQIPPHQNDSGTEMQIGQCSVLGKKKKKNQK